MTRLWPKGVPITVECDTVVRPTAFIWQRRRHYVNYIANQWLIDQFWWQTRICRQYYKVTTQTGLMVVIFQDRLSEQWYLEKLFD